MSICILWRVFILKSLKIRLGVTNFTPTKFPPKIRLGVNFVQRKNGSKDFDNICINNRPRSPVQFRNQPTPQKFSVYMFLYGIHIKI